MHEALIATWRERAAFYGVGETRGHIELCAMELEAEDAAMAPAQARTLRELVRALEQVERHRPSALLHDAMVRDAQGGWVKASDLAALLAAHKET